MCSLFNYICIFAESSPKSHCLTQSDRYLVAFYMLPKSSLTWLKEDEKNVFKPSSFLALLSV